MAFALLGKINAVTFRSVIVTKEYTGRTKEIMKRTTIRQFQGPEGQLRLIDALKAQHLILDESLATEIVRLVKAALFSNFLERKRKSRTEWWSKLDLNSRPLTRFCSENCPRVWRGIRAEIKAAELARISSPKIRLNF